MSVDLTQFIEGDDIRITLRATVYVDSIGYQRARILGVHGNPTVPLSDAVRAEHVTPDIKPRQYYMDGTGNLYIGHADGTIFGPLASQHARKYEPTELALIRGLRPAEVRPVVPA